MFLELDVAANVKNHFCEYGLFLCIGKLHYRKYWINTALYSLIVSELSNEYSAEVIISFRMIFFFFFAKFIDALGRSDDSLKNALFLIFPFENAYV